MRLGPIFITISILVGISAFGLLALFVSSSALPQINQDTSTSSPDPIILARRAISIPFGIDGTLFLQNENQVLVTGHGVCGPGGEAFKVRVDVTQNGVSAPAVGRTEALCQGDAPSSWQAIAVLPGKHTFEQGPATACGMAVIHYQREGALTYQWCREVILE